MANWEELAPKSDNLLEKIKRIENFSRIQDPVKILNNKNDESEVPQLRGVKIFSEFYRKYQDESNEDELENLARTQIERLRNYERECGEYAGKVRRALSLLEAVKGRHHSVISKTAALNATCQTLLQEQTSLSGQLGALRGPVSYFIAVEELAPLLGLPVPSAGQGTEGNTPIDDPNKPGTDEVAMEPKIRPGTDEFDTVVTRIDDCLQFYADHPQYHDSELYLAHMGQLQLRAFALMKKYVIEQTQQLRTKTEEELKRPSHALVEASLDTSPIYTKFKGMSNRLRHCVSILRAHSKQHNSSAIAFLEEVEQNFSQQRLALLQPQVRTYLQKHLASVADCSAVSSSTGVLSSIESISRDQLVSVVRFGAIHLLRVGKMEEDVFSFCLYQDESDSQPIKKQSFGKDSPVYTMLVSLNEILYHMIRPLVISQNDIDDLCELIGVIREEIFGESLKADEEGAATEALESCLLKVVEDAQERLILCVQARMQEEIHLYEPQDVDLDYPALLERHEESKLSSGGSGTTIYATWYPPLRSTLLLLSKIYRTVDMSVFEDLAQRAVLVTTHALSQAAEKITSRQTQLDGDLFLIKHLLVMREQLTPFDIQFLAVEKRLDFTSTASAFYAFLQEPSRIFRLDSSNTFLQFAADGIPKVNETTLDAKKELEETLKAACNRFIALAADKIAAPLLQWLSKAQAFTNTSNSLKLQEQAFAHADRVRDILVGTASQILDTLPTLMRSMALYLENRSTQSILFKPVQRKFLDAITLAKNILEANYTPQEFTEFWNHLNTLSEQVLKIDLANKGLGGHNVHDQADSL